MKTLQRWINVFCILAMAVGMVGNPAPAAAKAELALHTLAASQPARQPVQADSQAPAGLSAAEWADVQAQVLAAEYRAAPGPAGEGYRAFNRAQGFGAVFTAQGFHITTSEAGWTFGLELTAYGGLPLALDQGQALSVDQALVTAARGPKLNEWYQNTAQGLEHGLTLYAPPFPGAGAITLDFALTGSLQADLIRKGDGLRLRDPSGAVVLAYDGLAVYDANGRTLPASMALTAGGMRITVDAAGAIYPITVDPLLHSETIILYPSVSEQVDFLEFGTAMDLDGDTLVVGTWDFGGYQGAGLEDAPGTQDAPVPTAGKVFIFQRNLAGADAWGEVTVLQSSDAEYQDYFGRAVAISGDTIVVGAPGEDGGLESTLPDAGAVYIYQRNQGGADAWGEVEILRGYEAGDAFGQAAALDGDILVVGAPNRDEGSVIDSGAFYVFYRNYDGPDTWGFVTMQSQFTDWENFGASLALDGGILVVGSPGYLSGTGAVSIYYCNYFGPDTWGELVSHLGASEGEMDDRFGASVAIDGDYIVVGAPYEDGGPASPLSESGSAYVFERTYGGLDFWGEWTVLRASNALSGDFFGASVAIHADTIVVGATGRDKDTGNPDNTGAAYVFSRNQGGGDAWGEINILYASDAPMDAGFGATLAFSGNTLVVGAPKLDIMPYSRVGAAYVFDTRGTWLEATSLRASDAQMDDLFGWSVAVDGDTLVVGAQHEDGGFGGSYPDGGAVYVFQRNQTGADAWGEAAILYGSQMQAYDYFGYAVAISGNTIVVGAYGAEGPGMESAAGVAYVFERHYSSPDFWDEVAVLTATTAITDNLMFGYSVAIDGDIAVVGAPGANSDAGAYFVYSRNLDGADAWGLRFWMEALSAGDYYGISVAVSGDTIAIGAHGDDGEADLTPGAGAVHLYQQDLGGADNWGYLGPVRPQDAQAGDGFGLDVALSGGILVVGAPYEDGGTGDPRSDAGAAYVFYQNQSGPDAWGQVAALRASDAQVWDDFGRSVSIDGDTIVVGACSENGGPGDPLSASGAAYVFQRNQGGAEAWGQVRTLRASDAQELDWFGFSAAIDGNTIVVGADGQDGGPVNTGAAYVFTLQANWEPEALPLPEGADAGDLRGSVALYGNTLVVGAPEADVCPITVPISDTGVAYVYTRRSAGWEQDAMLCAPNPQAGDHFGYAVAVYSTTIVVGAYGDGSSAGAAYVFEYNSTLKGGLDDWSQVGTLGASGGQAGDGFGYSVAVNASTIVVGAPWADDAETDAGAAYVFGNSPTLNSGLDDWSQVGTLGSENPQANGQYGFALGMGNGLLAVGAPGEDQGGSTPVPDAGVVYVYQSGPGMSLAGVDPAPEDWSQVGTLGAGDGAGQGDGFGQAVALEGNRLVVGAPDEDGAGDVLTDTGIAYVFTITPTLLLAGTSPAPDDWSQVGTLGVGSEGDGFGSALALSSQALIVGAPFADLVATETITDAGAAYAFVFDADSWYFLQTLRSSDSQVAGHFGSLVAVDGEWAAVGAPNEDGDPFAPLTDTGAAYTFDLVLPNGAPVVLDDSSAAVADGTGYLVDVLANDSDPNNDPLVITAVGAPAHGVAVDLDLHVVYTPTLGFSGSDSFTYTVTDGNGGYATGLVTVLVTNLLVAEDMAFNTPEDIAFSDQLEASGAGNSVLTFTWHTLPLHGVLNIAASGTFTYTPGLDYVGMDGFTFTVSDGALTDTGRVDITVTAVNDAPLADDQAIATVEDIHSIGLLTAIDVDNDPLTYLPGAAPQHGEVNITSGGVFTYTPTQDYYGIDQFTFVVSDGVLTDTGQVDVTVISADAITTSLSLAAAPAPSAVGQAVTFTATVSSQGALNAVQAGPTGTVVFRDGLTTLVTRTLDASGDVSFSTAGLAVGEHILSAEYLGAPDYQPSSFTLTHTVAYIADLSTNITATLTPGQVVYTIVVSNGGFNDADGTGVSVSFPGHMTNLQWTCAAVGGATCTASGSSTLQDVLASFPVGGVVTYTVTANRIELETLYTEVTVTLPDGMIDLNPGNNQAHFPPGYRLWLPVILSAQPQ